MLRLWGVWLVASAIAGLVYGWRRGAGGAAAGGLAAGLCALAFNMLGGDSGLSAFWSMLAAGGGLAGGGLAGSGLAGAAARRRTRRRRARVAPEP